MSDETVTQNTMIDGVASTMDVLVSCDGLILSTNSVPINDASTDRFVRMQDKVQPKLRRVLDLVAAMILLMIMLPLGCFIVLLLVGSGQHPFCSRRLIGQGGREFGRLKFRTLRGNTDEASAQFSRDPGGPAPASACEYQFSAPVTRLGRVLRVTGLEELPQLINILIGDMSFVGPRPVAKDELAWLNGSPDATAYSAVRPGLTGWYLVARRTPSARS